MTTKPQNTEYHKAFGSAAKIPESLATIIRQQTDVMAFSDGKILTIHFPNILNNQDLTVVYDQVSKIYPEACAMRTASDERAIQIPTSNMKEPSHE